jgi:hypothetical protein
MTATATGAQAPPIDWDEERWSAARPLLGHLVEHVPNDDAPMADRQRALNFAIDRAGELARRYPTEAPGKAARELLDALAAVRRRQPQALPDPSGVPQSARALARLASQLAADPSIADRLDEGMVAPVDAILGGPERPLATYYAARDAALEELARACDERLGRLPQTWRSEANAPTRAERERRRQLEAQMGPLS